MNCQFRSLVLLCFQICIVIQLSGCFGGSAGTTNGSIVVLDETDNPHSFQGATVTLSGPGQSATLEMGAGTEVSIPIDEVDPNAFYAVSFECDKDNAMDACTVNSPVRVVLSGNQLTAGGWIASALTEIAYQKAAYYLAASYPYDEILQRLNSLSEDFFKTAYRHVPDSYEQDTLLWDPLAADAREKLVNVDLIDQVSGLLASGASSSDLQSLISSLGNPVVASPFVEFADSITVAGNYAYLETYVITDESSLTIFDVSDPAQPEYVSYVYLGGGGTSLFAIEGSYAYIAIDTGPFATVPYQRSLLVIDISDPESAAIVGSVDLPNASYSIAVDGSHVYALMEDSTLQIIDVSDPLSPSPGVLLGLGVDAQSIALANDHIYVAAGVDGLLTIDISNPDSPMIDGEVNTPGYAQSVAITGTFAYIADGEYGMQIADVSVPGSISLVAGLDTVLDAAFVTTDGSNAYLTTGDLDKANLILLNTSDPADPKVQRTLPIDLLNSVASSVSAPYVYMVDYNGFLVLNVGPGSSDPILEGALEIPFGSSFVAVDTPYAYVAQTSLAGLNVVDVSNPTSLNIDASVGDNIAETTHSIALKGDFAYALDNEYGIRVVDVSDPLNPQIIDSIVTPGYGLSITIDGDFAYIADGNSGLQVVDLTVPTTPLIVAGLSTGGFAEAVAVSGSYAYVVNSDTGLKVINIANPLAPVEVGQLPIADRALSVAVSGQYAFLAAEDSGLVIVDVSNPSAPVVETTIDTPGTAQFVYLHSDHAYLADGDFGVQVMDIADPENAVWVGVAGTTGAAGSIYVDDGFVYVGTDYGLEMLKAIPY